MAEDQVSAGDPTTEATSDRTPLLAAIGVWLGQVVRIDNRSLPAASTAQPKLWRDTAPQRRSSLPATPTAAPEPHPNKPQRRRSVDFSQKWRLPESDAKAMHEFEAFGKTLSEKTILNIGAIAFQMSGLKKSDAVKTFANAADGRFGLQRRSWAKFVRVCAHLPHVAYLSASDPGTFRGAVIGVRLALFPKLVEGDVEAGQQGKESAEVQLTRKFIKELLNDWGFNPRTGKFDSKKFGVRQDRAGTRKQLHAFKQRLDDLESQKRAQKEREDDILKRDEITRKAAEKQQEYFLNGFEALSADQKPVGAGDSAL